MCLNRKERAIFHSRFQYVKVMQPHENGKILAKKDAFFPVHAMKAYRGSRFIVPLILDLSTRWRWVVNFKFWPLIPTKETHYLWIGGDIGSTISLCLYNQVINCELSCCSRSNKHFFSPQHPDQLWPHTAPCKLVPGALLPEVNQMTIKLTSHLHLIPRLRSRGFLQSIPQVNSWRCV
jgi:hypothetical protein